MQIPLNHGIKYETPSNLDEAIEKYSVIINNVKISHKDNDEGANFSEIDMKATLVSVPYFLNQPLTLLFLIFF